MNMYLWYRKDQVKMLAILLAVLLTKSISGQFLNQPDAETLFVPLSSRVVLSCSAEQGYVVDWRITLVGDVDDSREAANTIDLRDILTPRNFTFAGVGSSNSTASFGLLNAAGEEANNGTNIACVAQQGFNRVSGNQVEVIFYGAPPPPTGLNVTENEQNSLNISWSLGFIGGVNVSYTLTVLNLNTTSAQPIIIAELLDQYYVFETSRPCDVYSFTVTAVTAAGNSTPSQELNFTREGKNELCSRITTPTLPSSSATKSGVVAVSTMVAVIVVIVLIYILVPVVLLLCCPHMKPKVAMLTSTSHTITVKWNSIPCMRRCVRFFVSMELKDEHGQIRRKKSKAVKNFFTFNHLDPGTRYDLNIAAANEFMCGHSTAETITTKHTAPSMSPEGLALSATYDSITVTWNSMLPNSQHGIITHYLVKIIDKESETIVKTIKKESKPILVPPREVYNFIYRPLHSSTAYEVYVAGVNETNHGPFAVKAIYTIDVPPPLPSSSPSNLHSRSHSGKASQASTATPTHNRLINTCSGSCRSPYAPVIPCKLEEPKPDLELYIAQLDYVPSENLRFLPLAKREKVLPLNEGEKILIFSKEDNRTYDQGFLWRGIKISKEEKEEGFVFSSNLIEDISLEKYSWFHSEKFETERKYKKKGLFMVRESENREKEYTFTVYGDNGFLNYRIYVDTISTHYYYASRDKIGFKSIQQLVNYFCKNPTKLNKTFNETAFHPLPNKWKRLELTLAKPLHKQDSDL